MDNLIPSEDGVPVGFTFKDCLWLSKNGIDYRDAELLRRLRQQR